ncbi:MAG: hypothetical protein KI793_23735 [Rivularia sp. (in: Bacteria)]|nr:hypothetical protein [Rivularia sp. MS3]
MKKKFVINVVTGQGGGGHYATYRAIRAIAEQQQLPWQFQVTDMDEIITGLSQQNKVKNAYEMLGFSGHDLYNLMVKGGWTWLWPLKMRLNKLLVKLNYDIGIQIFEEYWRKQQPDLVVSVMPLYNKGLWESLQRAKPGTPYITLMTDFADCPPDFWIDPEARNHIICGTPRAANQARSLGVEEKRIIETSGLVVNPSFYKSQLADKSSEREKLGLDANRLTGLVMFGGNGSKTILDIAKRLECFQDKIQLIFICGRNQELASELNQNSGLQKRFVTAFTENIPYYMHLADFFIGKPGNVSISEAMVMKLPVITESNYLTMIQEKYCAQWIKEKKAGIVVSDFRNIERAVAKLILPENYSRYQANLDRLNNRAVFEVIEILEKTLQQSYSNVLSQAIAR